MKPRFALLLSLAPYAAVAWNYKEKVFMYQVAETLPKFYINTPDERVIYERVAMFLGDYGAVLGLRNDPTTEDYRIALQKLLAHVEKAKKQAANDAPGVISLDVLRGRLEQSFIASTEAVAPFQQKQQ
ncbi:hypothetical protein FBU59_004622 [Linderina macrospora]|uniref:Uncharacterized protein n=1 Tax=Linderina macrospora TaxID=4868 RepID=A0ACC1J574_9FUNG|nr:hypothetical protein FBU59_004622 [Linderina macrospora]